MRKSILKIAPLFFSILAIFISMSCSGGSSGGVEENSEASSTDAKLETKSVYQGYVYDSITNKPITGAVIRYSNGQETVEVSTASLSIESILPSEDLGFFRLDDIPDRVTSEHDTGVFNDGEDHDRPDVDFNANGDVVVSGDTFNITITANGYFTHSEILSGLENKLTDLGYIYLSPKALVKGDIKGLLGARLWVDFKRSTVDWSPNVLASNPLLDSRFLHNNNPTISVENFRTTGLYLPVMDEVIDLQIFKDSSFANYEIKDLANMYKAKFDPNNPTEVVIDLGEIYSPLWNRSEERYVGSVRGYIFDGEKGGVLEGATILYQEDVDSDGQPEEWKTLTDSNGEFVIEQGVLPYGGNVTVLVSKTNYQNSSITFDLSGEGVPNLNTSMKVLDSVAMVYHKFAEPDLYSGTVLGFVSDESNRNILIKDAFIIFKNGASRVASVVTDSLGKYELPKNTLRVDVTYTVEAYAVEGSSLSSSGSASFTITNEDGESSFLAPDLRVSVIDSLPKVVAWEGALFLNQDPAPVGKQYVTRGEALLGVKVTLSDKIDLANARDELTLTDQLGRKITTVKTLLDDYTVWARPNQVIVSDITSLTYNFILFSNRIDSPINGSSGVDFAVTMKDPVDSLVNPSLGIDLDTYTNSLIYDEGVYLYNNIPSGTTAFNYNPQSSVLHKKDKIFSTTFSVKGTDAFPVELDLSNAVGSSVNVYGKRVSSESLETGWVKLTDSPLLVSSGLQVLNTELDLSTIGGNLLKEGARVMLEATSINEAGEENALTGSMIVLSDTQAIELKGRTGSNTIIQSEIALSKKPDSGSLVTATFNNTSLWSNPSVEIGDVSSGNTLNIGVSNLSSISFGDHSYSSVFGSYSTGSTLDLSAWSTLPTFGGGSLFFFDFQGVQSMQTLTSSDYTWNSGVLTFNRTINLTGYEIISTLNTLGVNEFVTSSEALYGNKEGVVFSGTSTSINKFYVGMEIVLKLNRTNTPLVNIGKVLEVDSENSSPRVVFTSLPLSVKEALEPSLSTFIEMDLGLTEYRGLRSGNTNPADGNTNRFSIGAVLPLAVGDKILFTDADSFSNSQNTSGSVEVTVTAYKSDTGSVTINQSIDFNIYDNWVLLGDILSIGGLKDQAGNSLHPDADEIQLGNSSGDVIK